MPGIMNLTAVRGIWRAVGVAVDAAPPKARFRRATRAIAGIALCILAAPPAEAQRADRTRVIAVLWAVPAQVAAPYQNALETGLQDLGWVAGKSVRYEHRFPESLDRVSALAVELVALKPDVIVAAVNPGIQAAMAATSTIPIVMIYGIDPVGSGLVASLSRPGGNVTGLTFDAAPELFAKDLQLLREMLPRAKRIAIVWNQQFWSRPALRPYVDAVEDASRRLSLGLRWWPIAGPDDIERSFRQIAAERTDGVFVMGDGFVSFRYYRLIGQLAASSAIPSAYPFREWVDAGGLMSYGPNILQMPRYAAKYVHKILNGERPADIPVEQPTTFELVINRKAARVLGLTVPRLLLLRADHLIE